MDLVDKFAGNAPWVNKACTFWSCRNQQYAQRWLKCRWQCSQFTLRQAAQNGDRLTSAQDQETLFIVQQFPGQAKCTGNITDDADLSLLPWLQAPRLKNAYCPEASKDGFI